MRIEAGDVVQWSDQQGVVKYVDEHGTITVDPAAVITVKSSRTNGRQRGVFHIQWSGCELKLSQRDVHAAQSNLTPDSVNSGWLFAKIEEIFGG